MKLRQALKIFFAGVGTIVRDLDGKRMWVGMNNPRHRRDQYNTACLRVFKAARSPNGFIKNYIAKPRTSVE